jgi:hypothetical protein
MVVVSNESKRIQAEIDRIQGLLNNIKPIVAGEKAVVDKDNADIAKYTGDINELRKKLKKVTDTHQSSYDSISGKITKLQADIASCRNPKPTDPSISPNVQNALNLEQDKIKELSDTTKIFTNLSTVINKFNISYGEYDSAIRYTYQPQIADFKIQLGIINDEIDELNRSKEANKEKIELLNQDINDLKNQIDELIIKDYSNQIYNNENVLNLSENIDTSLNYLFSYLKTQALSSDVIYEKIEHRDNEHEKLYTSSKVFDIIFYCFYFSFVIIMICTENIKREHFLIYLFVGLIPFIYPFVFKFVHYLIKYVSNDPHGPKNAFVDINNTIIAYNE